MNDLNPIFAWILEKAPLIVVATLGVIAGESIRGDEKKQAFKLRYAAAYFCSALLVVAIIDNYDFDISLQIAGAIAGGFVGKKLLVYAGGIFEKKIGVRSDGNDFKSDD